MPRKHSAMGRIRLALVKVGQNKEALPWFERKSKTSPDDYLWLLTYADALTRAGRADTAWQLRKYVLFNLRARLKQIENESSPKMGERIWSCARQYLALVRYNGGRKRRRLDTEKISCQRIR